MRTGLTRKQKTTEIFYNEADPIVTIITHRLSEKNRLKRFTAQHPDCCRFIDDNGNGGETYEVSRRCFSFRLTEPYSEERRERASQAAKDQMARRGGLF